MENANAIRLSDPLVLQELTRQRETLEKIETKLDRFDVRLRAVENLATVAVVLSAAALVVAIAALGIVVVS